MSWPASGIESPLFSTVLLYCTPLCLERMMVLEGILFHTLNVQCCEVTVLMCILEMSPEVFRTNIYVMGQTVSCIYLVAFSHTDRNINTPVSANESCQKILKLHKTNHLFGISYLHNTYRYVF